MDTAVRAIMIFMSILITVGFVAVIVGWWVSGVSVVFAVAMTCLDLVAMALYYLVTITIWMDIFGYKGE